MEPYEHQTEEKKIAEFWENEKIYRFDGKKAKKKANIYSIDTPPPTLSGEMHIGHAFSYSQQDFIARFHRMFLAGTGAGKGQVFYPFGTDDNGLPTERLVERLNGVKSKEVSRTDFIDLCLRTLKEIRPSFIQAWKKLGISCDYEIYYSTIDNNSRKISQKNFLDLFKRGLVYKKDFPTIWCPECQTAIAQAELEDKEIPSSFVTIKFSAAGKELPIATTRPELLQACVAIFVNTKDSRYKHLKGKRARIPIFDFEVPVIFDNSANMEKGTGAMMVCSYGDKYDVDAILRHKLKPKIIFDKKGIIIEGKYKSLKVKEARKKILEELEKKALIQKRESIIHTVNVHDKCGTEIEFLPSEQWFIKILDKKKTWISQGRKIKWHPEHMRKRYENWVSGLQWDWNISRDRHFGVPIPVWECKKCKEIILAGEKELPVDPFETEKRCPKCGKIAEPEKKVLDTWATSSLTPQIVSSLVGNKIKIPFSLRPHAHEIIRTWTFYTIVKSYLAEKQIPWEDIMLSGYVKLSGEKMSKSKGNVIDPKEVINQFGTDALRFWAASSKLGEDLDYDSKDLVTGKRLVTKLLNASNFVFMNLKDYNGKSRPRTLDLIDKVFLKKLHFITQIVTENFLNYEYSKSRQGIEQFFWKDFCDNYLEIVKKRIYNEKGDKRLSAQYTLYQTLLYVLKMLSPIMPFITEYVYQKHYKKFENDKSIHTSKWPDYGKGGLVEDSIFDVFKDILSKIRGIKTENRKPMNAEIILTLEKNIFKRIEPVLQDLKAVANALEIKEGKEFKIEFV